MLLKKIIVADDSAAARFMIRRIIEESGTGFSVEEARDGLEAYTAIRKEKDLPSAVIISLNLRKMSGITLLKKLRKNTSFDSVRLVIISESGHEKIRKLLEGCFIAGIIKKPVNAEELAEILQNGGVR